MGRNRALCGVDFYGHESTIWIGNKSENRNENDDNDDENGGKTIGSVNDDHIFFVDENAGETWNVIENGTESVMCVVVSIYEIQAILMHTLGLAYSKDIASPLIRSPWP